MKVILDFIKFLPAPIVVSIASLIVGAAVVYAAETRYMTVSDFTKSYVLDLKKLIREIQYDLREMDLTERERHHLELELEELIDELCYEKPDDRLCGEDDDA